MVFASDSLPINDLHGVILVRVVLEVAVVDGAVLAAAENFRREHDLDLVPGEGNNFAARLQRQLLFLLFLHGMKQCVFQTKIFFFLLKFNYINYYLTIAV